jgi:glycosyltransferase involved in cell wall biosynthesis
MASGCPVIVSSDVGCHLDLIDGNSSDPAGLVYPVGDVYALCAALQSVFSTPEKAERMGQAARRRMATWSFNEDVQGLQAALACTTRNPGMQRAG